MHFGHLWDRSHQPGLCIPSFGSEVTLAPQVASWDVAREAPMEPDPREMLMRLGLLFQLGLIALVALSFFPNVLQSTSTLSGPIVLLLEFVWIAARHGVEVPSDTGPGLRARGVM